MGSQRSPTQQFLLLPGQFATMPNDLSVTQATVSKDSRKHWHFSQLNTRKTFSWKQYKYKISPQLTRRHKVQITIADIKAEISDVLVECYHFLLWIRLHATEQNSLDNLRHRIRRRIGVFQSCSLKFNLLMPNTGDQFIILNTGLPNRNRTFLRYHISAATTDIIMRFLRKCSEITAKKQSKIFLNKC